MAGWRAGSLDQRRLIRKRPRPLLSMALVLSRALNFGVRLDPEVLLGVMAITVEEASWGVTSPLVVLCAARATVSTKLRQQARGGL